METETRELKSQKNIAFILIIIVVIGFALYASSNDPQWSGVTHSDIR